MDPYADRRDSERRHDGPWSVALKVLTAPVSIITLLIGGIIGTVKVVQQATAALPAAVYYDHRNEDSLRAFYENEAQRAQLTDIQSQVAGVRTDVQALRARDDSVIRLLRRSVCRQDPDGCP